MLVVAVLLQRRTTPRCRRSCREPFDVGRFVRSFWISPREHPDFAWAWLTRFLVNLGNALGLLYLLYFLQDVLGFTSDEAENRVFMLTAMYAGTLVLTTVVFGAWSDRLGRRKVFVIWSGLVGGVRRRCCSAPARAGRRRSWPRVVMGCSYGIYVSVDFALITEVLPGRRGPGQGPRRHQHRQRAAAGRRAGPGRACSWRSSRPTGGAVETDGDGFSTGYLVVYAVAFLSSVLGSVFVTRIRGVR